MKRMPILCLLLLCLIAQRQQAQVGFNLRYDLLDSAWAQHPVGVELHPNGYLIFIQTVYEDSIQHSPTRATMLIDPAGNMIWEKLYKEDSVGTYHGWANVADRTTDGGYVIGGARDTIGSRAYVNLVRYDQNADTLWTRTWGNGVEDWAGQQVKQTLDGGFIVAGAKGANGLIDGFVLKTDSLGNEEWLQLYGGGGAHVFASVDLAPDGGYYLGGQKDWNTASFDPWIVRIDSIGNIIWQDTYGSVFDDPPNAHLASTFDGKVVFAGAVAIDGFGNEYPYLVKIDDSGTLLWEKTYGQAAQQTTFFSIKECTNTDYIAAGVTYAGGGGQRGLLLRTNSNGDSLWMRDYYYADTTTGITQGRGRFWDAIQTPDGGFIGCGWVGSDITPPGYSQDTWVVKVDSMGCIVPGCDSIGTAITEQVTNLTDAIKVWPNPVVSGGIINVRIDLPQHYQGKELRFAVVSSTGQLVHEEVLPNNNSPITLNPSFTSGLYFLHLTDGTRWLSGTKFVVE